LRSAYFRALVAVGTLPLLVLGFTASALANKVVFVLWAVAFSTAWALVLRWGVSSRWGGWIVAGRLLLLLAVAATVWARLVTQHGEELELAGRALVAADFPPALARPQSGYGTAIALAVAGALSILVGHGLSRLPRSGRGVRA
jgi:hypothetical protein